MTTFVLVHGSYHGGWCWGKVEPRLRANGHEVYTPTLTGLGERSHLTHPRVGLGLHVEDVGQVFEYEDLHDLVLVGHSYGGMVVTGVAETWADRIAHLVYLDAYVPDHGQSAADITSSTDRWDGSVPTGGRDWLQEPPDPETTYGMTDPADADWVREHVVPTPVRTHVEPLDAPEERAKELPRTYVSCTEYPNFRHVAAEARDAGLSYRELETGHDAMVTAPRELSAILEDVAATVE